MMALKVVVTLALVAHCLALPQSQPSYFYSTPDDSEESLEVRLAPEAPVENYGPAKYDFNYIVRDAYSSNDFGHQEIRDGDRTDGSYHVQLPDGRLQKVTYYVDGDSGYVAEVTYEGKAHHPEPAPRRAHDSIESHESVESYESFEDHDSLEDHSDEDDSIESHSTEDDSSEEHFG